MGVVDSLTCPLILVICYRLLVCLSDLGWNHQEQPCFPRSCEPNWERREIRAPVRPTVAMEPVRRHGGQSHLASSSLSSHHWAQSWSHLSCLLYYPAEVEYHQDDKTRSVCMCVCVRVFVQITCAFWFRTPAQSISPQGTMVFLQSCIASKK